MRWPGIVVLAGVVIAACIVGYQMATNADQAQEPGPPPEDPWARARENMVEFQLKARGIRNERVLEAMRKVPRHEFVPEYLVRDPKAVLLPLDELPPEEQEKRRAAALPIRRSAYEDTPLPIGWQQTISQPYIVAFMTEALDPQPDDVVLEIGTGSGYQAAVLAELVRKVYTIEILEPLARRAKATLQRLGYDNVEVKCGDGYQGWPEHAPFDAIIVTCAPEDPPPPLVEQLREGGKMVIPLGSLPHQELVLLEKRGGRVIQKMLLPVQFVPMTGEAQKKKGR